MAKAIYAGVGNVSKKVKKLYVGINNVSRKVKKIYVGVNGAARLAWSGSSLKELMLRDTFGTAQYVATTEDYLNYTKISDEIYFDEFTWGYLIYHDGFMYRLYHQEFNGGETSVFFQRKKIGDTAWTNITQLSNHESVRITVTYNPTEKIFTFTRNYSWYAMQESSVETTGTLSFGHIKDGVNFTGWTIPKTFEIASGYTYDAAFTFYAAEAYYCCQQRTRVSGSVYYYSTYSKYKTNSWVNVSTGATYMEQMVKFGNYWIGTGTTRNNFEVYALTYSTTSLPTQTKLSVITKNNRGCILKVVGSYIYALSLNMVVGSSPSSVTVYRSSDGLNFIEYSTLYPQTTGNYHSIIKDFGYDGEYYYFAIYSGTVGSTLSGYMIKTRDFATSELISLGKKYPIYGASNLI